MLPSLPAVVLLCGGLGTRLRSAVGDCPKVLADVAGRPFLAHLLDHLCAQGAHRVVLSAGHQADRVRDFVAQAVPTGLDVRTVVEATPLGTGGAIALAMHDAEIRGPFLAINGDTYFGGSLRRLAGARADAGAAAALALVRRPDTARYGAVAFDERTEAVTAFVEKGRAGAGWINAGAYALTPRVLDGIEAGQPASLERDILPALVGRGLLAVPFAEAAFLDIGTPEDYGRAEAVLTAA